MTGKTQTAQMAGARDKIDFLRQEHSRHLANLARKTEEWKKLIDLERQKLREAEESLVDLRYIEQYTQENLQQMVGIKHKTQKIVSDLDLKIFQQEKKERDAPDILAEILRLQGVKVDLTTKIRAQNKLTAAMTEGNNTLQSTKVEYDDKLRNILSELDRDNSGNPDAVEIAKAKAHAKEIRIIKLQQELRSEMNQAGQLEKKLRNVRRQRNIERRKAQAREGYERSIMRLREENKKIEASRSKLQKEIDINSRRLAELTRLSTEREAKNLLEIQRAAAIELSSSSDEGGIGATSMNW